MTPDPSWCELREEQNWLHLCRDRFFQGSAGLHRIWSPARRRSRNRGERQRASVATAGSSTAGCVSRGRTSRPTKHPRQRTPSSAGSAPEPHGTAHAVTDDPIRRAGVRRYRPVARGVGQVPQAQLNPGNVHPDDLVPTSPVSSQPFGMAPTVPPRMAYALPSETTLMYGVVTITWRRGTGRTPQPPGWVRMPLPGHQGAGRV
jgi:hypothetical protein